MTNYTNRKINRDVLLKFVQEDLEKRGVNTHDSKIDDLLEPEIDDHINGRIKTWEKDQRGALIIRLRERGLDIPDEFEIPYAVKESHRWLNSRFPNDNNWRLFRKTKTIEGD